MPINALHSRFVGFAMVFIGASLWGLSGTAAQRLFQIDHITPEWLVTVRMAVAGLLLLVWSGCRQGVRQVTAVWGQAQGRLQLAVFALFGLLTVQFTYFAAIRTGNAATATFLQYLGPSLVVLYGLLRSRRSPGWAESVALLMATLGTLLLVTNGSLAVLVVPPSAVMWGLLSALALAFYTLYPGPLLARWGAEITVGWGMLLGGLAFSLYTRPWYAPAGLLDPAALWLTGFVVLFGTLLAFYLYLASLRHLTATEASLTSGVEPLSAAAAAVLWLHVQLTLAMLAGGLLIVAAVMLLAIKPRSAAVPAATPH